MTYPITVPMAAPGEWTTFPGTGGFSSPPFGHACPDCGTTTFAITNRRVACLACSVSTRGSSMDPRTRLYPGEEVCGSVDTVARSATLDREFVPYLVPVQDVSDVDEGDDAAPMDRSDEAIGQHINRSDKSRMVNVAVFDRGDFERYVYPENRGGPNVGGPVGELKPVVDPIKYHAPSRSFVKKSALDIAADEAARKRRPTRGKVFADGPTLFGPEAEQPKSSKGRRHVHPDQ
jgi:hypothetical protein